MKHMADLLDDKSTLNAQVYMRTELIYKEQTALNLC